MAKKVRGFPPSYGWMLFWLSMKTADGGTGSGLGKANLSQVGNKFATRYTGGGSIDPLNAAFKKAFMNPNPGIREWMFIAAGKNLAAAASGRKGWKGVRQDLIAVFSKRQTNQEILDGQAGQAGLKVLDRQSPALAKSVRAGTDKNFFFVAQNPVSRFFELIYRSATFLNPLNWVAFLAIWLDEGVKASYLRGLNNDNNLAGFNISIFRRMIYSFLATITASIRWVCTSIASPLYYIFGKKGGLIPGIIGMGAAVGVYALIMASNATPLLGFMGGVPFMAKVVLGVFLAGSAGFPPAALGIVGAIIAIGVVLAVGAFFSQGWSNLKAVWRAAKHTFGIESVDQQEERRLGLVPASQGSLKVAPGSQNASTASLATSARSINASNKNSPEYEMRELHSPKQTQSQESSSSNLQHNRDIASEDDDPFNEAGGHPIGQSGIYEPIAVNPLYVPPSSGDGGESSRTRVARSGQGSGSSSGITNTSPTNDTNDAKKPQGDPKGKRPVGPA